MAAAKMDSERGGLNRTAEVNADSPRERNEGRAAPPLPNVVLVCHSRERSLDMTSPALRLCMETARAVLALASRPWEVGLDAEQLREVGPPILRAPGIARTGLLLRQLLGSEQTQVMCLI